MMVKTLSLTGRAISLWWREIYLLIFFNLVWLILQFPIITGPPATAAMYVIAQKMAEDEYIGPRDGWVALRKMFIPGLKWGLINAFVILVLVGNFWVYQDNQGTWWSVLRVAWGAIGVGWFTINLFYWPFWLSQEDQSWRTTMRNSLLFMAKRPGLSLSTTLISAGLIAISYVTTLPMTTILMAWIALVGVLAVEDEIKGKTN